MKVRMKETKKGSPDGTQVLDYQKGSTYDLPDGLANAFINAGWAVVVKPEPPEEKVEKPPETKIEKPPETKVIDPPETKDDEPGEDKNKEQPKVEKPPEPEKKDKK